MSLETISIRDNVTLWKWKNANREGTDTFEQPKNIVGEFQHVEGETNDAKGTKIVYHAKMGVKIEIPIGSLVREGKKKTVPTQPPINDLYKVVEFRRSKDVKGRNERKVAILQRYNNQLPNTE